MPAFWRVSWRMFLIWAVTGLFVMASWNIFAAICFYIAWLGTGLSDYLPMLMTNEVRYYGGNPNKGNDANRRQRIRKYKYP
ncbi:hypothetical protein F5Y10DRAFT_239618 [Nemania abortiva]|nr:hypothetical protein F5Y10DRAFT_239618 [Nemania abortiva]